jgi:DNA topoisomerase IB
VRHGRGFAYVDADGNRVRDTDTLQRIDALVIPPAWDDVWICPWPNGHIQATGTDAAGRRQYRYHDQWRRDRDRQKHEKMLEFAAALPAARERMLSDLRRPKLDRRRVLGAAARLLDLGFFRIGSEEYAETNKSYGLATMRRDHVTVSRGGVITFDYIAKSGKHRVQSVADEDLCRVITSLKRQRHDSPELLGYRSHSRWVDIKSHDINDYLREITGAEFTAKDFRTWNATVLCAVALAVSDVVPASENARKRNVTRAVKEVAHYLGNTPAVCRSSYIDPRVIDLYNDGVTIRGDLDALGEGASFGVLATQGAVEAGVIRWSRAAAVHGEVVSRTPGRPRRDPGDAPAGPVAVAPGGVPDRRHPELRLRAAVAPVRRVRDRRLGEDADRGVEAARLRGAGGRTHLAPPGAAARAGRDRPAARDAGGRQHPRAG